MIALFKGIYRRNYSLSSWSSPVWLNIPVYSLPCVSGSFANRYLQSSSPRVHVRLPVMGQLVTRPFASCPILSLLNVRRVLSLLSPPPPPPPSLTHSVVFLPLFSHVHRALLKANNFTSRRRAGRRYRRAAILLWWRRETVARGEGRRQREN